MSKELFCFAPEVNEGLESVTGTWQVLSVEDDPQYQATLHFSLRNLQVLGRPLQLLKAQSAAQAVSLIPQYPNLSVILLDVVMGQDDAGLRLVRTIREVLGNATVRIILLTGQPGMAPREDVMRRFDIDDYWCKSELTSEHLHTIITGNIRTWQQLTQLQQARQSLQLLIDASHSLYAKRDLDSFAQGVLEEISQLLDHDNHGIVCTQYQPKNQQAASTIIAASGAYRQYLGASVEALPEPSMVEAFRLAARSQDHLFFPDYSVFYFGSEAPEPRIYMTMVRCARPLEEAQISLLKVFCENVRTGFVNVALYNRLGELAYRDPHLGCFNGNWLLHELETMRKSDLERAQLMLLRVENVNDMNVTFGAAFCQALMQALYDKLQLALPGALIVRMDEASFGLLQAQSDRYDKRFFDRLLEAPLTLSGSAHSLAITLGVVVLGDVPDLAAHSGDHLVHLALSTLDMARYRQCGYLRYQPQIEQAIAERYSLLSQLRLALNEDQLFLELQPKVQMTDGSLVGFEALVRWRHPEGKIIRPDQFIPLAEMSGLIGRLDHKVLRMTLDAIKALHQAGIRVPVAFNASGIELVRPLFFETLQQTIQESGVDPCWLELEITESQAVQEYDLITPNLNRLIQMGMQISIDDFGTGYSSLTHLAELAATTLKIDKSFVQQMGVSEYGDELVTVIIRLASRFGYKIIAEGVETQAQRDQLLALGCPLGQGYLFARPMPLADALVWSESSLVKGRESR